MACKQLTVEEYQALPPGTKSYAKESDCNCCEGGGCCYCRSQFTAREREGATGCPEGMKEWDSWNFGGATEWYCESYERTEYIAADGRCALDECVSDIPNRIDRTNFFHPCCEGVTCCEPRFQTCVDGECVDLGCCIYPGAPPSLSTQAQCPHPWFVLGSGADSQQGNCAMV